MSRSASRTPSNASSVGANATPSDSVVPTLRVMRLQSPELHQSFSGSLIVTNAIEGALCLPDSLGVFVGERFTAYLGLLNASKHTTIRKLAVSALLQTPSQRWHLPSPLDPSQNASGGADVAPNSGIDAIVAHDIEEPGQHILRVEVSYVSAADGNSKSFRKFYRFQVVSPFAISTKVLRSGDAACFVSVSIQRTATTNEQQQQQPPGATTQSQPKEQLLISDVTIEPRPGLTVVHIDGPMIESDSNAKEPTAVQLFDDLTLLSDQGTRRYLFKVQATSKDAILRGVVAGDDLGRAVVTWCKAMGETGRIASLPIVVPPIPTQIEPTDSSNRFVAHNSGLSVDVATIMSSGSRVVHADPRLAELARRLPVTVEPIDPPPHMQLHVAQEVQFLIVNHGSSPMNLQLQFRLSQPAGLAICGASFQSLGQVPPNGGSTVASARFLPLTAGLQYCEGCCIVDLATQAEIEQPALFQTFVAVDGDHLLHQ